jgi:hypothetical protein
MSDLELRDEISRLGRDFVRVRIALEKNPNAELNRLSGIIKDLQAHRLADLVKLNPDLAAEYDGPPPWY